MELHHSIAVASAEQKPRPRKLERKSSFNKKSSPTRSASRRRRRSVTHTVVELSSQHPVFVAKVERVHQLQHNSNTTPGFFKKYFQREEVEMCMDVSLQKAGLHSRAGRSQDRVGHQGEFTHIEVWQQIMLLVCTVTVLFWWFKSLLSKSQCWHVVKAWEALRRHRSHCARHQKQPQRNRS